MTAPQAAREIAAVRDFFRLLPYPDETTQIWQRLVIERSVGGRQTHDAHLVALMLVNGVNRILTFNCGHFGRFPGVAVLDPVLVATPATS